MVVNGALQPITNGTVHWLPSDTEELYRHNLSNPERYKLLAEHNWLDAAIDYTFNSNGFRSQEFVADTPALAVFGCSHTQGIGLRYSQVWHQHLSTKLNNKPVFNFGIGGCSADTCYRLAERYLSSLYVDTVVMLTPMDTRFEFWSPADSFPWFVNVSQLTDGNKFLEPWFLDPRNAKYNADKNIQSIAYICQQLNIDFYCYNTMQFLNVKAERSYARDLLHYGEDHNVAFANLVYNDIDFKRVYHPHWLNRAQLPRS